MFVDVEVKQVGCGEYIVQFRYLGFYIKISYWLIVWLEVDVFYVKVDGWFVF